MASIAKMLWHRWKIFSAVIKCLTLTCNRIVLSDAGQRVLRVRHFYVTLRAIVGSGLAMRVMLLCFLLCCGQVAAKVDVEKTMKDMAFQYKQAYEASDSTAMLPALQELGRLTEIALEGDFQPEQAADFKQGLQQVHTAVQRAADAARQQNTEEAKAQLRQVDKLRKQYHDKRKVSIWQLLFG